MEFYITLTTIGLLVVALFFAGNKLFTHKKREAMIKNFDSYVAVLQYHMEKAYNMVHKDQILVYSIEATTLPDKEFHKASIDFINLVQKLLGPTLTKEMVFLYGNYDTFVFNLAEYFNTNYDTDAIRKASMDDMMQAEVEPEGS
jgi:anthranilate/para-aminobenzoate synthase component II